jgi:hypothetical protein
VVLFVPTVSRLLVERFFLAMVREPDPDVVATPALLMAFDIMYCNGRDLCARPLHDRPVGSKMS